MSPDVPVFKVRVCTSDFKHVKLNWSKCILVFLKHSNSNFAQSFDFHCPTNFEKNINLS